MNGNRAGCVGTGDYAHCRYCTTGEVSGENNWWPKCPPCICNDEDNEIPEGESCMDAATAADYW